MVRALILYYLNIKTTHGYEIQKFIQETGLEQWTPIKSGSIYYALAKLEKNEEIALVKEESHGSRVRRIYAITEKGKAALHTLLQEKLAEPLLPAASEKFILPFLLNRLDEATAIPIINKEITSLREKQAYWKYWKGMKINKNSTTLDQLTFEIPLISLDYAIKWHEALLENYKQVVQTGQNQENFIRNFNFDLLDNEAQNTASNTTKRILELKQIILSQSENSKEALDELVALLSSKA